MYLSFTVHKLEKFLSNTGKLHFEGLVHLLRYIRDNKNLGLKYYADIKDSTLYDLLRQANITTNNQLMAFSDSSWQDCSYNVRITEVYICVIYRIVFARQSRRNLATWCPFAL